MRKEIKEIAEIPEGISVKIERNILKLEKNGVIAERKIPYPIKQEGNKLILESIATKKTKKLIKTGIAHIRNMVKGLEKKFIYKLQICSVHFPINVSVKGNELVIKNFLGEAKERKAVLLPQVDVKIDKEIITVESHDKEKAGQTAANIEQATRIRNRDRRIFQDGCYIISKQKGAGK